MPDRFNRPNIIPNLRDEARFKAWLEENRKKIDSDHDVGWGKFGDQGYWEEIDEAFGDLPFCHSLDCLRKNKGRLKIVSLGGGAMRGMLEFKDLLEKKARAEGLEPDIELIDYSLKRKRGMDMARWDNRTNLIESGKLRIHIGPLETKVLSDAEGADTIISVYGPIFHGGQNTQELIVKTSRYLAPGGMAFEQISFEPSFMLNKLRRALGQKFNIEITHDMRGIERPMIAVKIYRKPTPNS